jgi:hypothetical protein
MANELENYQKRIEAALKLEKLDKDRKRRLQEEYEALRKNNATVEEFPDVDLAFAWTQDKYAPLILGQMNFFLAFDVCFYRSESAFEISQK